MLFVYRIKQVIKRFIPRSILLLRRLYRSKEQLKPREMLYFEVHVADHCNLNCKWCSHFSSIAKKKFLDIDRFEQDCRRLSELTKRQLHGVTLLGGEPMLHPEISDVFAIIRKYFDNGYVNMLTNGTLLTRQKEEFWKSCKKNNVGIYISYYPIKIDYDGIEALAKKHGVKVECEAKGVKTMRRDVLDIYGKQDMEKNFKKCFKANQCIQLDDGRMYTCSVIPNIVHFNAYFGQNLQVRKEDSIDIYKVNTIKEIYDFLCQPAPFCKYCNIKGSVLNGLKWEVSKKEITEWT